ncbi:MAG: hypothetical protein LBG59_07850 [Candidatus Peribacteria bacterium]|jgi:hypothetical protein|nr:hypothetical protein [Candidatus Peribacteria bacterium]
MELLKNMYGRKFNQCSSDVLQSLPKKEFKEYVNANGGFSRGKVLTNSINAETKIEGVPEGSIYLEMELSDESENMNGYVIEIDAREKPDGLKKFFNDFGGKLLYQHNQQEPIGKTLDIGIREDATGRKYLRASAYAYDDYTENRLSRNLVTDISTSHLAFEIIFRNRET